MIDEENGQNLQPLDQYWEIVMVVVSGSDVKISLYVTVSGSGQDISSWEAFRNFLMF